jgi:citrate synthase
MNAIRSDLGWSTRDRIVVRGKDLPGEILGRLNLGDMAFFELTGKFPDEKQSRLFNAMAVTLVEHGVTPSALAARLTYLGAPEAMQAAVAAGLCGLGSVFVGSMEGCASSFRRKDGGANRCREQAHPGAGAPSAQTRRPAHSAPFRDRPRDGALREVLPSHGRNFAAEEPHPERHRRDRRPRLRARPRLAAVRGIGVMARAVGLVGHLLEESRQPMAEAVWHQIEEQASRHLKR